MRLLRMLSAVRLAAIDWRPFSGKVRLQEKFVGSLVLKQTRYLSRRVMAVMLREPLCSPLRAASISARRISQACVGMALGRNLVAVGMPITFLKKGGIGVANILTGMVAGVLATTDMKFFRDWSGHQSRRQK